MKKLKTIFLLLAASLLLIPGCSRRGIYDFERTRELEVRVHIPAPVLTRAEIGDVASNPVDEATIQDLHIWVFLSESITYTEEGTSVTRPEGYCLAYLNPEDNALSGGGDERYRIPLSDGFANACIGKHVNVYALANVASAGISASSLNSSTTASEIESFIMSGTTFGLNADGTPVTTSVPATGLPFAGVGKNLELTGSYPVIRVSTITMERAVSKLRFVFCQLSDAGSPVADFAVTGISLDGGLLSAGEYLVNDSADNWKINGSYESAEMSIAPPTALALNTSPGDYLYTPGTTGQAYDDLIRDGVSAGVLTECGLSYLRETDKALKGKINYTVDGVAKESTFEMSAAGEFSRNHSWIIYSYFIGGRLVVQPTVLPWIAGQDRMTYTTIGRTELKYEQPWLRYDVDRMSWTWNDTWLVVAYGYEGGNAGKPTHSPMFTLETINPNDLSLQLNNDHFIIVQMAQGVDAYGNAVYTYTKHDQTLSIPGSSNSQTTNFYVVPVSDDPVADPYVKVTLTETHTSGQPPEHIPFNHNLPGDEDHTSILIYNPGLAVYNANIDKHKNNSSNEQAFQYWLEEEG